MKEKFTVKDSKGILSSNKQRSIEDKKRNEKLERSLFRIDHVDIRPFKIA